MTRIRFENAPSTNTPINADNLNKLNNVVISSSEPTTGEEVWFKKNDTEKKIYVKNDNGIYEEFSRINDISLIPLTINEDYVYSTDLDYICVKIGNIVLLKINTIAFKQKMSNGTVFLSGLPKPKQATITYLSGGMEAEGDAIRILINNNAMNIHHSTMEYYGDSANKQYFGTFIYETNE